MQRSPIIARRRVLTALAVAPLALLSSPASPAGSPGMEGLRSEPYDVLTFDRGGATQVFARYR